MKKILGAAVALAAVSMAPQASAQTVVNLDGVANASLDGSNAVTRSFGPGTYRLNFTQDQFTAFTRFSNVSGCDAMGANCSQGFENSARYVIDGTTFSFGDGAANGGIGPIDPGDGYFDSAARSFANAGQYSALFTLANTSDVSFYIVDDLLTDNSGGVSLSISAIPEPATWGMMITGFGLVGASMRRRKVRTAVAFA